MCRKLIVVGLAIAVGMIVLKKTELGSLVRVWWGECRTHLDASVSPETRVKQLRQEIAQSEKRLERAAKEQSRLEVSFEALQREVDALKATQTQREKDMRAMLAALEAETKLVAFDGKQVEASELQKRLDQSTRVFKTVRETVKAKEEVLAARKEVVEASDARLAQMKQRQAELVVVVEKLDAQIALLRMRQTDNKSAVKGNDFAEADRLVGLLHNALAEEAKFEEVKARHGLAGRNEAARPSLEETKRAAREALNGDE